MTSLLEAARKRLSRGTDLGTRIAGLERAVNACEGRLAPEVLDVARATLTRAGERMRLSPDHTVVALAGATGSGKSSTFNAIAGIDLAATGVRRPTTSWATACVWPGPEGADDLLEWMGIPPRHRYTRESMLDPLPEDKDFSGLVLLDLPDHDSTEVSHHLEVQRLIVLADLMVWVLDPQKYADAAVHDTYLKPLTSHKEVIIVALNHIDEVPPDRRVAMVADVQRLLGLDGLDGVPVVPTSARHGDGIAELRRLVAAKVKDKSFSRDRFRIDLERAAADLREVCGTTPPRDITDQTRRELVDAVADSAGVPVVVDAVRRASRGRAARVTGWPPLAWLGKLRPDPLKRLRLSEDGPVSRREGGSARRRDPALERAVLARSSIPAATPLQRARVDTAIRAAADEIAGDLTRPWAAAVRRASTSQSERFADTVDRAVAETPLGVAQVPWWCRAVQAVQWAGLLCVIAGAAWLATLAVMSWLQLDAPEPVSYSGFPLPTLLLVLGAALGLVLAALSRALAGITARSRARRAERRLRESIADATQEMVLAPVEAELAAYQDARAGLAEAGASGS